MLQHPRDPFYDDAHSASGDTGKLRGSPLAARGLIPAHKGGIDSPRSSPRSGMRVWQNNAMFEDGTMDESAATATSPYGADQGRQKQQRLQDRSQASPSHQQEPGNVQSPGGLGNSLKSMWSRRSRNAGPEEGGETQVCAFDADEDARRGRRVGEAPVRPMTLDPIHNWEVTIKQMLAANRRQDALTVPAPSGCLVRCYVRHVKSLLGTSSCFQLFLENGHVFLMAARRRKKSKTSSYVISQDSDDLKRDTDNCVAKLKSNFTGSEYMLWGKTPDPNVHKGYAAEQLCIGFQASTKSIKGGPRCMHVSLPLPESSWTPGSGGSDSLSAVLEQAHSKTLSPATERELALLTTKLPQWDETVKGYTLDFHGRVKEASVKNFQLVGWDHSQGLEGQGNDLLLQFGRVDSQHYALDFAYPMCLHSAFAVALASIDTKLCYSI